MRWGEEAAAALKPGRVAQLGPARSEPAVAGRAIWLPCTPFHRLFQAVYGKYLPLE